MVFNARLFLCSTVVILSSGPTLHIHQLFLHHFSLASFFISFFNWLIKHILQLPLSIKLGKYNPTLAPKEITCKTYSIHSLSLQKHCQLLTYSSFYCVTKLTKLLRYLQVTNHLIHSLDDFLLCPFSDLEMPDI